MDQSFKWGFFFWRSEYKLKTNFKFPKLLRLMAFNNRKLEMLLISNIIRNFIWFLSFNINWRHNFESGFVFSMWKPYEKFILNAFYCRIRRIKVINTILLLVMNVVIIFRAEISSTLRMPIISYKKPFLEYF